MLRLTLKVTKINLINNSSLNWSNKQVLWLNLGNNFQKVSIRDKRNGKWSKTAFYGIKIKG